MGKKAAGAPASSKAAAKPKAKKAEEDPAAVAAKALEAEALEKWEKYMEEESGVVKLKHFAQCIRDQNVKKVHPWNDDEIGNVIKGYWKDLGGFTNKELKKDEFLKWWPEFVKAVDEKVAEVEAAAAKKEEEKKAAAAAKASRYDSNEPWEIPLNDLQEAINEAYKKDKTPFIVDNTEGARTETFFTYSGAHIVEAKKMIMDKVKGGSVESVVEEVQRSFFGAHCFKYGQTVVFRLSNSALDVHQFSTEAFPILSLLDAKQVKKVMGTENAGNFKDSEFFKMVSQDKKNDASEELQECTYTGVHEKFRVVCISTFQLEDYKGFLENVKFPLDLMQVIVPKAS